MNISFTEFYSNSDKNVEKTNKISVRPYSSTYATTPIPVAVRYQSNVCSRLTAGDTRSSLAEARDVRLSCFLCCVRSDLGDGFTIFSEDSHCECLYNCV